MIAFLRFNIFIALFCVSETAYAQENEKFNIGIVGFYNLENLYDTIDQDNVDDREFTPAGSHRYTGDIYRDKLMHLDRVLSEFGTDHSPEGAAILGVAEIENRSVLNDLCNQEGIKSRAYKIVHYDSKDARGVDVGLLYNPKYFKLIESEKLHVDLSDLGEGKTRDILYATGLFMGSEIHIMVGHWPSRRGGEEASMPRRCRAAEVMRKKSDSIYSKDPKARIIVMGDLNDDPSSVSVIKCLRSSDVRSAVNDGTFYNPFADYFNQGIGTLAYNDVWNLFDQILVSPSFIPDISELTFSGAYIFSRKYMISLDGPYTGYPLRTYAGDIYQRGYSDHFPTYIVLKKRALK